MDRAYATLTLKAVDEAAELRLFDGIASTPAPDRTGDVLESTGARFELPMPLLWQHRADFPIGQITAATVTPDGIRIRGFVSKADVSWIREAWAVIREGLVRGLSVGFQPIGEVSRIKGSDGWRFKEWLWLETSAVTIPANVDAAITTIKSLDTTYRREAHARGPIRLISPAAVGPSPGVSTVKSFTEQLTDFQQARTVKAARMGELLAAAAQKGETLDAEQATEYDGLEADVRGLDEHIRRTHTVIAFQQTQASPVAAVKSADDASVVRAGSRITVAEPQLPPGIPFIRLCLCKAAAYLDHMPAIEIAKTRYPDHASLHMFLKADVPAGTTTHTTWASPLVNPANLPGLFAEYLRPQTILGKFGTNGIPALRDVPFNTRGVGQTTGGSAGWVGEGKAKPLTKFDYAAMALGFTKVAAITTITEELARFSTPKAELLVRDALAAVVIAKINKDFIDPAVTAITGSRPASITNTATPIPSSGNDAAAVRADLAALFGSFVTANMDPSGLVLIMSATNALALSLMTNALGQREFAGLTMSGGTLNGIPVIVSEYAGTNVVAVNAPDILLADDGDVRVDVSREASLEMSDAPTHDSTTPTGVELVSMFQTNSIAIKAERFINWAKMRATSVAYLSGVTWGAPTTP